MHEVSQAKMLHRSSPCDPPQFCPVDKRLDRIPQAPTRLGIKWFNTLM
ncbi:MAG: hypothetical protein WDN29_13525 [Methylovirgula sp.]